MSSASTRSATLRPAVALADALVPSAVRDRLGGLARDTALVAGGALLIALSAAASIRLPDNPVPISGQTFGVLLAASALGLRRGLAATVLYVAIGVIGFPAFAEGKGGLAVIAEVSDGRLVLGATGGYLLGFVLASALTGRLAERGWDRRLPGALAAMPSATPSCTRSACPGSRPRPASVPPSRSRRVCCRSSPATQRSCSSPPACCRPPGGSSGGSDERGLRDHRRR